VHRAALDVDLHGDLGVLQEAVVPGAEGVEDLAGDRVHVLLAVALLPADADANHGEAVVLDALEVVAGEDAQASGIDLEGALQGVFHAEIGDLR